MIDLLLTGHELREVTVSFPKDHIPVLGSLLFQLLLQVTTTVLVLGERQDLALQVLQSHPGEPVVYGTMEPGISFPLPTYLCRSFVSMRMVKTHTRAPCRPSSIAYPSRLQGKAHPNQSCHRRTRSSRNLRTGVHPTERFRVPPCRRTEGRVVHKASCPTCPKQFKAKKKNEEHQQYAPQADQVVHNLTLGPPARGPNPAGPTFWNAFAKSGLENPR